MGSKGGSGGGSNQMGFQATTSTYTPNPEAMQAYRQALGMAENVASIPYEAYQGQMTAGFTPDQLAAFQGTREMQGMAQPYINAATSAVNQSMNLADPRNFTPAALQQYYNPYQQNVIESSKAMMAQQNAQQQADLTARAIQQGAYGGDRSGVARAALMGQQALANQQVLAGLQQQGYQQAVSQYNQQQQQAIGAAQQGAYSLGQLGLQGQQAALQGIQALLGTGGMQQQLGQQQLTAAYNQWLQARAYPYQQANFYAGIASGIAPNMGGTTNTMGIGSSQTQQQQAQGGGGGAGLLTSALSFLPMLMGSDRNDKTDIKYIGKDPETGEKMYEYRYKGDPKSYPKVVGPMAQDIEEDEPERVHEIGGHKVVEGLGHLRQPRADGGSSIYSGQTVDPYAYQQSPYQADQRFDPGFSKGLEAVIDPALANQIARSKWVSAQPDQSQSQQTIDEQMQYRNPEFNLFPYFQDGQQSQSPFDGNAEKPEMYADGGGVGGLGDLMKAKTPFGAAAPYVEALPITPGKANIPDPPKGFNWLPGLPGGGPSSGGGGGGSGGGGGMPKLPKMGGSKAASAGAAAPHAEVAAAAASPEAGASAHTPEAAAAAPAPDMGAAAAPAMDAGLGGLGGLGGGGMDFLSGLGGILPMFSHGGRIHKDGGGAAGAAGPSGAIGSNGFEGALGAGVGAIPGLIGQEGTGTLGSLMPSFKPAPTKGPMGDMSYKGWLDRAMLLDPGPQTTPEEQGQPSLPKPGSQPPRPFMPGEMQSKVVGEQNKGIDPMLMMGMGKMGGNLAMSTMLSNQQASNDAKSLQKEYQQKRADILATPQAPAGYSQSLASNIVNPHTGLFNVNYGTYYMPHYAKGGRIGKANGGGFNYGPSMQLYYDLINSGKMTPQAAAGYAGNFSYEATGRGMNQLNPAAVERGVPFNKAGLGYAQWTNAHRGPEGRHTDFLNFAKQTGQPWGTHAANLDYFNKERSDNPFVARADEKVQMQPTIPAAAKSVMQDYERPGAAEAARSLPMRVGMSEHIGDIAQAGNPFQGEALAEQSARASAPDTVVADDSYDTGGQFAGGGRVHMAGGGGLDERTASLANRAMNYFLSKGYSKAAAAGIVANLIHESGGHLNPSAHGDLSLGAARSAWGIGQWRENRFRNLQNFAKAIGRDWRDFDTQLAFVDRELKSDYGKAYRGIVNARTPQEAAAQMMMHYEIPAHRVYGDPSTYKGWGQRSQLASMLGGQNYRSTSVAGYGAPASAPVRTLAVRPLTGERAGVVASDVRPAPAPAGFSPPPPGSALNALNPKDPSGPLLRTSGAQPVSAPVTAPAVPAPGFSLANLNPISTAYAADENKFPEGRRQGPNMPRGGAESRIMGHEHPHTLGELGMIQQPEGYATFERQPEWRSSAMGASPNREMLGDTPYAVTMAGAPLGPWDNGSGFSEEHPVVSADEKAARPAAHEASRETGKGPYWGDYRDYEPWKSDPIGGFFDELTGDRPQSTRKGASMMDTGSADTDQGGFDLLKELGFADGGSVRHGYQEGGRSGFSFRTEPPYRVPENRRYDIRNAIPNARSVDMPSYDMPGMSFEGQAPYHVPENRRINLRDYMPSMPRLAVPEMALPTLRVPEMRNPRMNNLPDALWGQNIPEWRPNIPVQEGGYPRTIGEAYPVQQVIAETPAAEQATQAAPVQAAPARQESSPSARPASAQPASGGQYWGDYRDYEPWRSDPIGVAFDRIMGDAPHSSHKGASMWDVGGGETAPASLGDLFRQYGGRVNMADGGDPLANLDPEMFSPEPMVRESAGFTPEALAPEAMPIDEEPAPRVVATDRPEQPEQVQQQPGFGGLRSPITGQPMEFGPLSQAMLAAGLGMMASDRVNPLQAIGEGGLRGLEYYQSASAQERADKAAAAKAAHDFSKERLAESHWQQEMAHKRNVAMMAERAREAAQKRLLDIEERRLREASPQYKQQMMDIEGIQKESMERQKEAKEAEANLGLGKQMLSDLESGKVKTGIGAETLINAERLIQERGPEAASKFLGIDPEEIAATTRFAQMSKKLTLSDLGGKLGAGVSNADLAFINSMEPGIGQNIETNKRAVKAFIKLQQRAKDVAEFERRYRSAHNGYLGPEFRDELAKWADEHPLFDQSEVRSSYTPQQAAEELKRRRAGVR